MTQAPAGTRVSDVGSALRIGDFTAGARTFDGVLDEVAVWNGAQPTLAQFLSYVAKARVFSEPIPGGYGLHEGDRVQVPVTGVFTPTQGGVFARLVWPVPSTALPVGEKYAFSWRTDNNNRIGLAYGVDHQRWQLTRLSGGAGASVTLIDGFDASEGKSALLAWTEERLRFGLDGGAITEVANTAIPVLPESAELGTFAGSQASLLGNLRWAVLFGGTFLDDDNATLHACGDTPPAGIASLLALMPDAQPRLLWDAVTASYETACYVLNDGDAPVHHAVVEVRGEWADLEVKNLASGEFFSTSTPGTGLDSVLRIDAGRMAVEFSEDGGETFVDDYAQCTVPAEQVALLALVPGLNVIVARSSGSPTASVSVTYRAAFE